MHAAAFSMSAAPARNVAAGATGVKRNANFGKLQAGYLFPEIARRRNEHMEQNPDAKIISLGIGDTTEPIPGPIVDGLSNAAKGLGTREGYSGYGIEQGRPEIREAIASRIYEGMRKPTEIFVSDGSKCDIGRLQMMFGPGHKAAVQDPAYPVYVDTSVMFGNTGDYNGAGFDGIVYMDCTPENDFFPDLAGAEDADLIFFCSPNNPTGAAATREQLTRLVDFAKANGSIIIYDAAYALYIDNPECPKSIYEIPGAEEVAIETCSFSKYAGFTGVRLGWTVVPEALKFADGTPVQQDWTRVMTTMFNGASNVVQAGGLAALSDDGWAEVLSMVAFYKENAKLLRQAFLDMGFEVYGGTDAPYVWVRFPGMKSWDTFQDILSKCNIVVTPGSGFGNAGEGFVRASAFGHRENVLEAIDRLKAVYSKTPAAA
ncbi:unnamed protein product [Pedinophyceae sp. YPF-701]|nr:unnamed protein product [Pedinophyceae sp. YPF-701]